MDYTEIAKLALRKEPIPRPMAEALLKAPDADLLAILNAAFEVRRHFRGNRVHVQLLSNIKSGGCSEDCHYCSQSKSADTGVARYGLWEKEAARQEAKRATELDAKRYCMALAGTGPTDADIDILADMIRDIKADNPIETCLSIGFLSLKQAQKLKEAGLDRVNHNLNTSEAHYPNICTTHTYQDRVENLKIAKEAGLGICSGGIIGQGESDSDIIDMFEALVELEPASIPVNFLIPVEGTPFGGLDTQLTPRRCLKVLALCRFMHPDVDIRVAGGREYHLRSLQPMSMYAANSLFIEGYLTTGGMAQPEVLRMIEDLGFAIEFEGAQAENEVQAAPPERRDRLRIAS